jgi:hypothetical protein
VSFAVAVVDMSTNKKYITNILNFNNSVYSDNMIAFHDSDSVFYLDNNGYLLINGSSRDGSEEAIAQITGALIDNSTLSNIVFVENIQTSNLSISDKI